MVFWESESKRVKRKLEAYSSELTNRKTLRERAPDIEELKRILAECPDEKFVFRSDSTISYNGLNKISESYKAGDMVEVLQGLKDLELHDIHLKMNDGRFVFYSVGNPYFIYVDHPKDREGLMTGFKVHVPVHIDDVPKMEHVLRSMESFNPNFRYKFADGDFYNEQVGKVLTLYTEHGLDTPEKIQSFFQELNNRMDERGIRVRTPDELIEMSGLRWFIEQGDKNHVPNLLNTNHEGQMPGAEGRFYYTYDGEVGGPYVDKYAENYRGRDYFSAVEEDGYGLIYGKNQNLEYVPAGPYSSRKGLIPEVSGDIMRDVKIVTNSNKVVKTDGKIIVGEDMGKTAYKDLHELETRAKEWGILPQDGQFVYGYKDPDYPDRLMPESYRLELDDTSDVRYFLKANLTEDGQLIPKITIGRGMGENAKAYVRELEDRALKEGILKPRDNGLGHRRALVSVKNPKETDVSSYRLAFDDTPEVRAFLHKHLTEDHLVLRSMDEVKALEMQEKKLQPKVKTDDFSFRGVYPHVDPTTGKKTLRVVAYPADFKKVWEKENIKPLGLRSIRDGVYSKGARGGDLAFTEMEDNIEVRALLARNKEVIEAAYDKYIDYWKGTQGLPKNVELVLADPNNPFGETKLRVKDVSPVELEQRALASGIKDGVKSTHPQEFFEIPYSLDNKKFLKDNLNLLTGQLKSDTPVRPEVRGLQAAIKAELPTTRPEPVSEQIQVEQIGTIEDKGGTMTDKINRISYAKNGAIHLELDDHAVICLEQRALALGYDFDVLNPKKKRGELFKVADTPEMRRFLEANSFSYGQRGVICRFDDACKKLGIDEAQIAQKQVELYEISRYSPTKLREATGLMVLNGLSRKDWGAMKERGFVSGTRFLSPGEPAGAVNSTVNTNSASYLVYYDDAEVTEFLDGNIAPDGKVRPLDAVKKLEEKRPDIVKKIEFRPNKQISLDELAEMDVTIKELNQLRSWYAERGVKIDFDGESLSISSKEFTKYKNLKSYYNLAENNEAKRLEKLGSGNGKGKNPNAVKPKLSNGEQLNGGTNAVRTLNTAGSILPPGSSDDVVEETAKKAARISSKLL